VAFGHPFFVQHGVLGEQFRNLKSLEPRYATAKVRAWTAFSMLYPSVTDVYRRITAGPLPDGWLAATSTEGWGTPPIIVANHPAGQAALARRSDGAVSAVAASVVLHEGAHTRLTELIRNGGIAAFVDGVAGKLGVPADDLIAALPVLDDEPTNEKLHRAMSPSVRRLRAAILGEFGSGGEPQANFEEACCYALERAHRGGVGLFTDAVAQQFQEFGRLQVWDHPGMATLATIHDGPNDVLKIEKLSLVGAIERAPNAATYFSDFEAMNDWAGQPQFSAAQAVRFLGITWDRKEAARHFETWDRTLREVPWTLGQARGLLTHSRFDFSVGVDALMTGQSFGDFDPSARADFDGIRWSAFGSLSREAQNEAPSAEWLETFPEHQRLRESNRSIA
jgi:hypothetical protein